MAEIGFFEDFKGADTVLLSISAAQAQALADQLRRFATSDQLSMRIVANVIPAHEVQLVAIREARAAQDDGGFHWLCGPAEVRGISSKLESLANSAHGAHHYFELLGTEVRLLVSIGEYGISG